MNKGSMERGIKLYQSGKYSQAIEELLAVEEEPSENPSLAYYLGLAYTKMEKYEEALLYLEQAITAGVEGVQLYQTRLLLAYVYTITGRYKLAQFELEQLSKDGYESTQMYGILGYIFYKQKMLSESIEQLEKALELDPENTNILNSLGFVLAEKGERLEEALRHCKKAVSRKPKNPAYLDSLGWVCYKLKRNDEARRYLRQALDAASGNKTIARHLRQVMQG